MPLLSRRPKLFAVSAAVVILGLLESACTPQSGSAALQEPARTPGLARQAPGAQPDQQELV
jgi:hypothetical protein